MPINLNGLNPSLGDAPLGRTLTPVDPGNSMGAGSVAEERKLNAYTTVQNLAAQNTIVVPYVNGGIETVVVDLPSVPPEISFYPFKNVNNRIEILLNSNTGQLLRSPIAINPSDEAHFEDYYLRQTGMSLSYSEILEEGKKIEFSKDDPPKIYQIYRLSTIPTAYTDFAGNMLEEIDPEYGIPGSYIDTVQPNQKYYYCARVLDFHNNISNPTFVHELELVDNNGQIFLSQKVFTFPVEQPSTTLSGRRFVYVEPSLTQLVLPEDTLETGIADVAVNIRPPDSLLGDSANDTTFDKIWQKDFKLRVTSTKTGRKLDLNIKFKNSGIVNQTE